MFLLIVGLPVWLGVSRRPKLYNNNMERLGRLNIIEKELRRKKQKNLGLKTGLKDRQTTNLQVRLPNNKIFSKFFGTKGKDNFCLPSMGGDAYKRYVM
jgi:hypothetical protein